MGNGNVSVHYVPIEKRDRTFSRIPDNGMRMKWNAEPSSLHKDIRSALSTVAHLSYYRS